MRRCDAGFSLLELVVAIVLISVLLTVAIDRLLLTKAQAERIAMEQVLGSIRSGITIRMAELIAKGRTGDIADMIGVNPVGVLAEPPANYRGELFGANPHDIAAGSWYFDSRDRELCYLVESSEYFESAGGGPPRARFTVRPVFEDLDRNGRFDRGVDSLRGLRLAPVEPYEWRFRFVWPEWPWSGARRRG